MFASPLLFFKDMKYPLCIESRIIEWVMDLDNFIMALTESPSQTHCMLASENELVLDDKKQWGFYMNHHALAQ